MHDSYYFLLYHVCYPYSCAVVNHPPSQVDTARMHSKGFSDRGGRQYVCMHACMYVCIYFMYVCMYVCMYVYMYVCMYVYMYFMYVCTYICMYVCMYVCMYTMYVGYVGMCTEWHFTAN